MGEPDRPVPVDRHRLLGCNAMNCPVRQSDARSVGRGGVGKKPSMIALVKVMIALRPSRHEQKQEQEVKRSEGRKIMVMQLDIFKL